MMDTSANSEKQLISLEKAASQLDVSTKTIRRHFELVKIGDRALVRVADIQARIAGCARAT